MSLLLDMQCDGQRVTIMGLGHFGGGAGAARWLARRGAEVTVTDLADETVLADSLAALADAPIARFHLGGHWEADLREADLVVVNPAVRPDSPFLKVARASSVRLTSEIELFLDIGRANVIHGFRCFFNCFFGCIFPALVGFGKDFNNF